MNVVITDIIWLICRYPELEYQRYVCTCTCLGDAICSLSNEHVHGKEKNRCITAKRKTSVTNSWHCLHVQRVWPTRAISHHRHMVGRSGHAKCNIYPSTQAWSTHIIQHTDRVVASESFSYHIVVSSLPPMTAITKQSTVPKLTAAFPNSSHLQPGYFKPLQSSFLVRLLVLHLSLFQPFPASASSGCYS